LKGWNPRCFERGARFASIAAAAARFVDFADWPSVAEIDRRLASDAGVRFVAADKGPGYEARIALAGEVPTRVASWHDFLNALVWASFPRAKWALTARLHTLATARGPGNRSREEDFLALFDEGGVAIQAGSEIIFGHALFEHWLRDQRVSGLALELPAGPVDALLAEILASPFAERTRRVEL
jgi:hypothetical protein